MKQKIIVVLAIIVLLVLIGVTYIFYVNNQRSQQQLQQSQETAQKQIADLNDRLVAVARQQAGNSEPLNAIDSAQPVQMSPAQQVQLNQQRNLLRQQQRQWTLTALQLAQDSLRQGNLNMAQQLLLELQQSIIDSQQDTGDILNNSLLQALKIDQLNIAQQATRQQQARASLSQSLRHLQQQLNVMAVQAPHDLNKQVATHTNPGITAWIRQLVLVERASPETGHYMLDRQFIYKQASIQVSIARLALGQGDQVNFSSSLTEASSQLSLLPDPASQQLAQQLAKVKSQPWPASIELASLGLLTRQKASS